MRSAWLPPLFFVLSHAEIEVVVKQIRLYGAKHCETELIRTWHIELERAMELADDSVVSGAWVWLCRSSYQHE